MRIIRRSHSSCSAVLFTTGFFPIGIKLLGTWNVGSCFFSLAGSSTCLKLWQRPFLPIPTTLYQLLPIHTLWGIENSARFRSISIGEETYRCWTSYKTSDRLPLWCQALHPGAWQSSWLCQPATACYPTYQPIWLSGPQHPVTCHTVSGTWHWLLQNWS